MPKEVLFIWASNFNGSKNAEEMSRVINNRVLSWHNMKGEIQIEKNYYYVEHSASLDRKSVV